MKHLLSKLTQIIPSAIKLVQVGKTQPWKKNVYFYPIITGQRNTFKQRLQGANNMSDRINISCILIKLRTLIDHKVLRHRNKSWSKFIRELPPERKEFENCLKQYERTMPFRTFDVMAVMLKL